jgi:class 3 adenylate cyclase
MNDATADLLHQAIQAERLGRFTEARDRLRLAVRNADAPLDVRLRLGKLCLRAGTPDDYVEAETVLGEARVQAEHQGARHQAAAAIHLLALLHYQRRQLDEAQRLLDQSPALKQDAAPSPETAQLFHYRGLLAAAQQDLPNAERLYFRAHQFYREVHHDAGLAEVSDSLANLLLKRGKTRAALRFADLSLQRKRHLQDRFGEAISLGTKGRIELQLARYEEARQAFAADLALARELGDERGVGIVLNSLGDVALLQKDPAAAEAHFRDSLAGARGPINAFFAEAGLVRVCLATGRLDDAVAGCIRLADRLDQHPELAPLANLLQGLRGALAWRRGDLDDGAHRLREAIDGLRRSGHPLDTIPFLYELRDLYQHQGDVGAAVAVMAEALDLWSECGSERGVRDVEDWLRSVDKPSLVRLALERHLPPPLVQDVLNGKLVAQTAHAQRLTVLFSDLRDYTTLSEGLPPAELVELLNDWFSEATRAVRRHGGMVDKFIGDAVMALFGVPDARDDAAADAVRAALDMRDALAALNLRQEVLGGPTLRIGIGIDSGEAVVGFIGSYLRQSYTAIGDLVNTASRLEGATKDHGCDILISQSTHEGQERYGVAETTFLGKVKVKGKQHEVAVYQVHGLRGPGSPRAAASVPNVL